MAKEIQVAATGDGPATEKDCKKFEACINSWGQEEVDAMEQGNEAASRRAKSNVEGLINDATEIIEATDWQPHSVRGFFAGKFKKRLKIDVVSAKDAKTGERRYHVGALKA